jgi:hypothetical protein
VTVLLSDTKTSSILRSRASLSFADLGIGKTPFEFTGASRTSAQAKEAKEKKERIATKCLKDERHGARRLGFDIHWSCAKTDDAKAIDRFDILKGRGIAGIANGRGRGPHLHLVISFKQKSSSSLLH